MKTAEIIEVRDVTPAASNTRHGDVATRNRIEELLRRKPRSDAETAEIGHFLSKGNHLDVGLISGSDEFKEEVERFRKEHREYFRLKLHEIAGFLLVIGGPVGLLAWQYLT